MKLTVLLTLFGTLGLTMATSYSQETKLTLSMEGVKIKDLLQEIKAKSDFSFWYNNNELDDEQRVTVFVKDQTIDKILDILLRGQDLDYDINDRFIVIYKPETPYSCNKKEILLRQQLTIKGKVTDINGSPLPGVNVVEKGTTNGAITDLEGNYTIEVETPDAMLNFSYVGFLTEEVSVSGQANIDIVLIEDIQALDEVIVIGYGTQKKTSLTSAVSTLKAEKLAEIPASNVTMGLGGRVAGIIVRQTTGEPGNDANDIYIRGISSTGNTQPLLIVDGIPRGFQNLDPNTIETFTVLKDAAAVAPYGVAGANGVILITTKRGKSGTPTVRFNSFVGFQNPTVLPELPSAYEYASLKNAASVNVGGSPIYSDYDLQKFKDGSDPDGHPVHNVYDELFDKNTPLTNYNIELSGGTEKVKYYSSLGYQYQAGIWAPSYLKRFNYSMGIDAEVTKITKISFNLNGREQLISSSNESAFRLFELVNYSSPIKPLFFTNGEPGDYISAVIKGAGTERTNISQLYTQVSVEQELPFIPGLKAKGTFAFDPTASRYKRFRTPAHMWTVDTTQTPYVYTDGIFEQEQASLDQGYDYSKQLTYQANLTYNKTFGKNSIGVLALFEALSINSLNFGAARRNYDLTIDELNMGSSDQNDISNYGSSYGVRQAGLVYRLNYDYAQKYLLEVTGRYDGSYYFAPDERWGFFPAFSAGWRISEESFMQGLNWVDNLKIRGSYGEVGAVAGAAFQYLSLYNVKGPVAVLDGGGVQGAYEGIEANLLITWEKAKKTDIGLDATLWNGLLNIEADYFYERRSNMLADPTVVVPVEYGVGLSQVNAGKMDNRGVDISIGTNYHNSSNDLRVSLVGNFTFAKNKLIEVFETATTYDNPNRRRTGRPLGTKFGYEAIGYFQVDDFDASGNLLPGIAVQPWGDVYPGDVRYKDINGDGVIDNDDRTVIGDADIPQIIYGISLDVTYKRFTLDVLFQGVDKTDFHGTWGYWEAFRNGMGAYKNNLDYWTLENPNASHCRITPSPTTNNTQPSTYQIFDCSYLRLKSLNLSYFVPTEISKKVGIQNARVYVSGQNLLTLTQIENFDPEIIHTRAWDYPQQKVVSVGINLTFF